MRSTEAAVGPLFGDGVALLSVLDLSYEVATASMRRCVVANSQRAGVATFGGTIELADTRLECNTLDLDGEQFQGGGFLFTDLGGNRCGCAGEHHECQVVTTLLQPPDPPEQ